MGISQNTADDRVRHLLLSTHTPTPTGITPHALPGGYSETKNWESWRLGRGEPEWSRLSMFNNPVFLRQTFLIEHDWSLAHSWSNPQESKREGGGLNLKRKWRIRKEERKKQMLTANIDRSWKSVEPRVLDSIQNPNGFKKNQNDKSRYVVVLKLMKNSNQMVPWVVLPKQTTLLNKAPVSTRQCLMRVRSTSNQLMNKSHKRTSVRRRRRKPPFS